MAWAERTARRHFIRRPPLPRGRVIITAPRRRGQRAGCGLWPAAFDGAAHFAILFRESRVVTHPPRAAKGTPGRNFWRAHSPAYYLNLMSSTNGKAKPAAPARVNAARRSGASYVPTAFQSADDRIIGLVRLALALAALAIIYIDPSEPDKNVALTYVALVLYALYSATVYALSLRRGAWRPGRVTHWIDVA